MDDLKAQTSRVLQARRWSLRQAQGATAVAYSTIYNMSEGRKVGAEFLIRWARAIHEDVSDWLRWGGYEDLIGSLPEPSPLPRLVPRGTVEPDTDEDSQEPGDTGDEPQDFPPDLAERFARMASFRDEITAEQWPVILADVDRLIDRLDHCALAQRGRSPPLHPPLQVTPTGGRASSTRRGESHGPSQYAPDPNDP